MRDSAFSSQHRDRLGASSLHHVYSARRCRRTRFKRANCDGKVRYESRTIPFRPISCRDSQIPRSEAQTLLLSSLSTRTSVCYTSSQTDKHWQSNHPKYTFNPLCGLAVRDVPFLVRYAHTSSVISGLRGPHLSMCPLGSSLQGRRRREAFLDEMLGVLELGSTHRD